MKTKKDFKTQEEYIAYLEGKIDGFEESIKITEEKIKILDR